MEIVFLASEFLRYHFESLEPYFSGRFAYVSTYNYADIVKHKPSLVICLDEHFCERGQVIGQLKSQGIATLQVVDGIVEWRRTWDYRWQGHAVDGIVNPLNQPAIAHKIACLGRRDTRILESWGNLGKCEIVGAPRLDVLVRRRTSGEFQDATSSSRPRILVMTAKTPGFSPTQIKTTIHSLQDLKRYFDSRQDIEIIWRLTRGIEKQIGVENQATDLRGRELHSILGGVDAVITTASTAMLEAMLTNRPVALLDYHNTPHYFEAAWTIVCEDHIHSVVGELLSPPKHRVDYQNFLLEEQLAYHPSATDRLVKLIERMLEVKRSNTSVEIGFPFRILDNTELFITSTLPLSRLQDYYPMLPNLDDIELRELKMELNAARGTIQMLRSRINTIEKRLNMIPGYKLLSLFKNWLKNP